MSASLRAGHEERRKAEAGATASGNARVPRSISLLSYYMDEAFRLPGGFRIGWDAIIGIIPGFGDLAGLVVSSYIVLRSVDMGLPKSVIARMSLNILLETAIGSIPVLGDLFDIAFKANVRNMKLLERYQSRPERTRKLSRFWVFLYALAGLCVLALAVFVVFRLMAWLFGAVF